MNKGDLIEAVAEELKASRTEASKLVEAVLSQITTGLRKDAKVSLSGFGTFQRRQRAPRRGINPTTREPMEIRALTTCGFKPSVQLREQLDGDTPSHALAQTHA